MLTAKEIRESFKAFFASKGHQIVPSAPMVIKDDPTLMFTNAGMNQFKDIILGNVPIKYPRVADSQKCLRVSGKHNDLEEVGHDTYHHTMFEMLGNWSFGDYFKKEAIDWAWEFLVDVLKIDAKRLYVTVFEGSPGEGLLRDDEAAAIWGKYLPAERIINGNKKDNFWEMGDTGPCGPCSEIHIDIRPDEERAKVDGLLLVNRSHPQVIEIWNLVFMQYNRKADGLLEPLPAKVIDTGMGFERLCMAIQGKTSNYDTDAFQPIIGAIARLCGARYGDDAQKDIAMRVIADHVRTIAFSITDGQLPSNAKAGYVIRRILRRAVRYAYTFLGQSAAFVYRLIPALIETMGDAYPELVAQRTLIEKVIKEEEESFLRTLETGIKLLDKMVEESKSKSVSGKDAFTLYDTYGFPLDLTELILREKGMTVDVEGFNAEMQKQKERARNAAAVETGDWVTVRAGEPRFVGYDHCSVETEILRYRKIKQKNRELYQVVLSDSPFYAEMGGQVGDTGWLIAGEKKYPVIDTKRENNLGVHILERLPDEITATFEAVVDKARRLRVEANHTATHLLHEALREVLGSHVEQKGSYVSDDSLRFDFSHFQKVTPEEIRKAEKIVNAKIRADIPLQEWREMPVAKAREMGAMALFGEKYGDEVRVVKFGNSVELCGGTHIAATGMIGQVRVVGESSIAAGVRRIEALTSEAAENFNDELVDTVNTIRVLLNNYPNIVQAVEKSISENAELKKQIQETMKEKAQAVKQQIVEKAVHKNGVTLCGFEGMMAPDLMKDIAFQLRVQFPEHFFFVAGLVNEGKPSLMVALSDDLVKQGMNASELVRAGAKHIDGGGGGQPHFATAGGKGPNGIRVAVDTIIAAAGLE